MCIQIHVVFKIGCVASNGHLMKLCTHQNVCIRVHLYTFACACVYVYPTYVHACVRACVCACVCVRASTGAGAIGAKRRAVDRYGT